MSSIVIAANRLLDGVCVWLSPSGEWVPLFAQAAVLENDPPSDLLARARDDENHNRVVDLREVAVERDEKGFAPVAPRERMRAFGPSIRDDLPVFDPAPDEAEPLPSELFSSPDAGLYQYDAFDKNFLRERAERFRGQVARRLSGELSEEEFKPLRLMNGLYLQLHAYMLRVALPYGALSAAQMRQLAYVARRFDRGYGHFTTRQNLQFNWIRLEDAPEILSILARADLHAIQTSGNCVRNVTTDHFAGAAAEEVVDPRLYAEILRQWSTDHPEFTYLPRKFKIAITGSPIDRAAVRVHDIGLLALRNDQGEAGFQVYAGGGLGRTPAIGVKVRDWLPVRDLLRYVESILRVYNALGRRDNIYKARIKILIRDLKPETFIGMIEHEFADLPPDHGLLDDAVVAAVAQRFRQPPFDASLTGARAELDQAIAEDGDFAAWVAANSHPHQRPGYCSVVVSLKPSGGIPGDASAAEMEAVAALAEKFSFGEIRVAHQQNLVLPHVRLDALHDLWRELSEKGLATANIGLIGDIISCPGMDYCALATARAIPVAQRLSQKYAALDAQRAIGPLDLHVSGCINACGHHHVGHLGLLGVDKNGEEFYQITLGGSVDDKAAIGAIIGPAVASNEVVEAVDAILSVYLAQRQAEETFIACYRRLGAEPFKEALYADH